MQPVLPAILTILTQYEPPYCYVTKPTSGYIGQSEATGSHAVIDFCDRCQAISDMTAHIHYENMDKRTKNESQTSPHHLKLRLYFGNAVTVMAILSDASEAN